MDDRHSVDNGDSDFMFALTTAIKNGDHAIIHSALRQRPELLREVGLQWYLMPGEALLHTAIRDGPRSVVELILRLGADPNQHEEAVIGDTPLDVAVNSGNAGIITLLLENGANPNIPTWMWITATDRAIEKLDMTEYTTEQQANAFRAVIRVAREFPIPVYPDGTVPSFWPPQRGRARPERVLPDQA